MHFHRPHFLHTFPPRKLWVDYLPMLLTACFIIYFAVAREQSFIKTLPTLITLVVQLLLVRVNRYAFLLGGTNALIYGISYFSEGLYFSLISAVLISAPIQYFSFFHWSKKQNKTARVLRRLSVPRLLLALFATVAGWLGCHFALSPFFASASYPLLDSFLFATGITVSLLAAFCFVESQYLNIIASTISLALWILLTIHDPKNFNYIIISVYNLLRIIEASVHWTKSYLAQTRAAEQKGENAGNAALTEQENA
ncbi:MAG: nicotinamide mononucleotide transporter [Ruminococcaceae bacterium]|nr:nicotinamide mononucleotide transporter [Oscillospiraceae bacterium]